MRPLLLALLALTACDDGLPTAPPPESDADTDADADADTDADADADSDADADTDTDADTDAELPCLSAPDIGEDNDSLSTALPLPADPTDLVVGDQDEDFWTLTVPAGERVIITAVHDAGDADIDLVLFDAMGLEVDAAATTTDDETVSFRNFGTSATTVTLRVHLWDDPSPTSPACGFYDIVLESEPLPVCPPDVQEENDSESSAAELWAPLTDMNVNPVDPDYYSIEVPPGAALVAEVLQTSGTNGLEVQLWDSSGWRLDFDQVGPTYDLAGSNDGTAPETLLLEIRGSDCLDYDLDYEVRLPPDCSTDPEEENDTAATAVPVSYGMLTGLNVSPTDEDHFEVAVPSNTLVRATVISDGVFGDPELTLLDAVGTTVLVPTDSIAPYVVEWWNQDTFAVDAIVRVGADACLPYDLELETVPGPDCSVADGYEPNDTHLSPTDLDGRSSPLTGLRATADDPISPADETDTDFFGITVPDGHRLVAEVHTDGLFGLPRAYLWDGDPATTPALDYDTIGPYYDVSQVNTTGAEATWTVQVEAEACLDYDLSWYLIDCDADDALEPNDTAATAVALTSLSGLRVSDVSPDYFGLGSVEAGQTVTLTIAHDASLGDIDVDLEDLFGVDLPGMTGGASPDDLEVVSWTNTSSDPVDVVAHVFHYGLATCRNNSYDVTLTVSP